MSIQLHGTSVGCLLQYHLAQMIHKVSFGSVTISTINLNLTSVICLFIFTIFTINCNVLFHPQNEFADLLKDPGLEYLHECSPHRHPLRLYIKNPPAWRLTFISVAFRHASDMTQTSHEIYLRIHAWDLCIFGCISKPLFWCRTEMTTFISPHLITIIDKNQITFSLYGWGSPL